jgi:hypothetical protein
VKSRLLTLAAVSAAALVPAVQQSSARPQTTAPPPVVDIRVTISDAGIGVTPKSARRGVYARFILLNVGKKPHTFTIGAHVKKRGTGVQTGFSKPLKPGVQSILMLFLDYRGPVAYLGSLPADRSKPRMKGIFTIS